MSDYFMNIGTILLHLIVAYAFLHMKQVQRFPKFIFENNINFSFDGKNRISVQDQN